MPPPPPNNPKKRNWSQPLADLVGKAIDPVLARQGFAESDLILHWDDIVGGRLAASSRPIKLQWPPHPAGRRDDGLPQPATLVIRVEGAFAIELQHMADQLLARINAHLGWRCVGRLAFRQGPIERAPANAARRGEPHPDAVAAAAAVVGALDDAPLKSALTRLGARIAEKANPIHSGG